MNKIKDILIYPVGKEEQKMTGQCLTLIRELLDDLHKCQIIYCHWKSNQHLDASMVGDTDLDMLFNQAQATEAEIILQRHGFKKYQPIKQRQYKDIEDFIGLDPCTGKIVHVHAHFRLTLGETYLKGYQLDLEKKVLSTRIFNDEFGIFCSDPVFELILLYCREALKLRHRDVLLMYLGVGRNYNRNIINEYNWLKERIRKSKLKPAVRSIFNNHQLIYDIVSGDFNRRQIQRLSPHLKSEFRNYRMYTPSKGLLIRWYREVYLILAKLQALVLDQPILNQRVNPRSGTVVAVIGADGSGKSTITANLKDTFKEKVDVYKIYFGSGDGKKSFARHLLALAKQTLLPAKTSQKTNRAEDIGKIRNTGTFATIYKCTEALLIAHEKRVNLKRMLKAKRKGMLIICDRFPQNQVMGYNDGPLLHYLLDSANPVYRWLSKIEYNVYDDLDRNPPDIVIKLIAAPEVVEKRKPGDVSLEMLKAKIAGIQQLYFPRNCKTITIDAAKPLEEVLLRVKAEVWNSCP